MGAKENNGSSAHCVWSPNFHRAAEKMEHLFCIWAIKQPSSILWQPVSRHCMASWEPGNSQCIVFLWLQKFGSLNSERLQALKFASVLYPALSPQVVVVGKSLFRFIAGVSRCHCIAFSGLCVCVRDEFPSTCSLYEKHMLFFSTCCFSLIFTHKAKPWKPFSWNLSPLERPPPYTPILGIVTKIYTGFSRILFSEVVRKECRNSQTSNKMVWYGLQALVFKSNFSWVWRWDKNPHTGQTLAVTSLWFLGVCMFDICTLISV